MAWVLERFNILNYFQAIKQKLTCCDLCHCSVTNTTLDDRPIKQSLICQCCLEDLPLFNQKIVSGNLLQWPAISKALPKISLDQLFSLAPYVYPFDRWVTQMKYSGRFELATLFGVLLSQQWKASNLPQADMAVDLVIPVPLHINKWRSRGYNQANLIAKEFAKQLQLPYKIDFIKRIKNNDSQMGKTGSDRRKNLLNAFQLKEQPLKNIKHILIVDDVVTTGSTANEICKLLKNAGVEKVSLATVCLTLPKN